MFRKNYPDLDLLESPLISANPFGTMLGGVPGSAIAEKIFNDPESWHDSDEKNLLESETTKDPMAWLVEELEKFQGDDLSSIERNVEAVLRPFSWRYKVMPKLSLALPSTAEVHTNWEGVKQEEIPSHLASLELPRLNSKGQSSPLTKAWGKGGNIFRSFPSPVMFSPSPPPSPSPNKSNPPVNHIIKTGAPSLDLEATMEGGSSPIVSPVVITATSTTWSILELYGAPPTPRLDLKRGEAFESYPPTPVPPVPPLPSYIRNAPPPQVASLAITPLPKPPVQKCPPSYEAALIRRLPVIPDLSCNSSSPKPLHAKSTLEPPIRDTPPPLLPLSQPDPSSPPPIAHPPPSQFNRTPSTSRSPPAGPRARSGAPPKTRRNLDNGRESPFTISPFPSRSRHDPSYAALPLLQHNISV